MSTATAKEKQEQALARAKKGHTMEILVYRTAAGGYVAEGEHADALARLCRLKRDSEGRAGFPAEAWPGYAADLRARGVALVEQTTIEPEPEADVNQEHQLLLG